MDDKFEKPTESDARKVSVDAFKPPKDGSFTDLKRRLIPNKTNPTVQVGVLEKENVIDYSDITKEDIERAKKIIPDLDITRSEDVQFIRTVKKL